MMRSNPAVSKTKATRRPLFVVIRQVLFLAFFRGFCRLCRSFLLFDGRIELDSRHHDAVAFRAVLAPLFGLEVPLDGEHGAFGQNVERPGVLVLAPSLDIHEGGNAGGFLAVLFLAAYGQREACDTGVGELADFSVLAQESGYCEGVFDLFHVELLLEVIKSIFTLPKK